MRYRSAETNAGGVSLIIGCLLLSALIAPASGQAQTEETFWPGGPVHLPAIGLIEAFQFSPTIHAPRDCRAGRFRYSLITRWYNVWMYSVIRPETLMSETASPTDEYQYGSFLVDMESVSFNNVVTIGINDRCDVVFTIPMILISGGIMDGFIESFHDLCGIDQHLRDGYPRNLRGLYFIDRDGNRIYLEREMGTTHLGDIILDTGYVFRRQSPAAGLRFAFKFPSYTGYKPTGQDGVDMSLYYTLSWRWGRTYWYHGAGMIYYSETGDQKAVVFNQWRTTSSTSMIWPMSTSLSLLMHAVAKSPAADYPKLNENVLEVSLGLRYRYGKYMLDLALIENMLAYDNSPDFGVQFVISRSF